MVVRGLEVNQHSHRIICKNWYLHMRVMDSKSHFCQRSLHIHFVINEFCSSGCFRNLSLSPAEQTYDRNVGVNSLGKDKGIKIHWKPVFAVGLPGRTRQTEDDRGGRDLWLGGEKISIHSTMLSLLV